MINKSNKNASENYHVLQWSQLTLTHQQQGKIILDQLNGKFQSSDFLAIMGPSGAGKSSLLSIITARVKALKGFTSDGMVHINGQKYSLQQFSKIASYVPQDDLLFATLTVRQTFIFQAKLKLWHLSKQEQYKNCTRIMKRMNLMDCQNSLIGGSTKKSISGGQKKRVAIGVELLSNPQILVFDEPTSGLDSHNALRIIQLLKDLAKLEHKLIITTLHQPSSLIFQNLDLLYLMKNGQCIYNGKACQIVDYMQKLGIEINYRMNPADFFMLEISAMRENQGYKTPLNLQNYQQYIMNEQSNREDHVVNQRDHSTTNSSKSISNSTNNTPFFKQFGPLIYRSFIAFMRTPSNQYNKIAAAFFIPLVLGTLYIGAGNGAPENIIAQPQAFAKFMQQFSAFLFMAAYFVFALNAYDVILVFPLQKQLVLKQATSNLYSIFSYYFARLITEFLGCIIPGIISAILLYVIVGLELSFAHFAFFVAIFAFLAFQGYIFGIFFGVMCKDSNTGVTLVPIFFIAFLIVGGLPCNLNDVPGYISWLQYTSPMRHAFFLLILDQLKTGKNHNYFANPAILDYIGVRGDIYEPLYWEIGLFSFYFLSSIALLYWMKKRA